MALNLRKRRRLPPAPTIDTKRLRRPAEVVGDTARSTARDAGKRVRSARKRVREMLPAQRARRERRRRLVAFVGGTAAGAALAALLDPVRGKARRARIRDQGAAFLRRRTREARRFARRIGSDMEGLAERATHSTSEYEAPNDITLAHKVENEVFGRAGTPKGSIVVNAEEGVVILRGQVDHPDQVRDIERRVREVEGVHGVENLLHPKGTVPPNKAEARRTR